MKKYPLTASEWFWGTRSGYFRAEWDELGYDDKFLFKMMNEYMKYILTEYTDFLVKTGYCDTDVYYEPPTAIDKFLVPQLRDK